MNARGLAHSGMPLGGLGTGSVELRSDGYFHEWEIFNTGGWAPSQPEHERGGGPDMGPGALSFFLRTQQAKERLRPALSPGNVDKTMKAPVTAILAYDSKFYELMPRLFPPAPGMKDMFAQSPELAAVTAMRNGTLQGGYFILAARSLGLDCGPMAGFDNAKVDQEFFSVPIAGSSAVKSNFLCNLGYGDVTRLHSRGPRLEFSEACQVL